MEFVQQEKSRWYALSFWWFFLVSVAVAFLSEGIAFLEGYGIRFTDWGFFMISGVTFLLCLSYCIFAYRHFRIGQSWIFFAMFMALCFGNAIAIIFFPESTDVFTKTSTGEYVYKATYVLENVARARYIVAFAISCFYFYLLWGVAPKCLRSSRSILIYIYGLILMCLALIIYSWIAEWNQYVSYFDASLERLPTEPSICSFTGNRNTFAAILFLGIVCLGIMQSRRHFWGNYALMAIFTFQELLLFSKTCLTILPFYFLLFIVYRYVATVRFHPIRSSICLGAFIVSLGILAAVWALCAINDPNSFFAKITDLFKTRLFTSEHGTMDARYAIWAAAFGQMNNPLRIIFGLGEGNMQWLLGTCIEGPYGIIHNGYLLQFCTGGVLRSAVYVYLIGYVGYLFIKALIHKRKGTLAFVFAFGAMLAHAFSETTSFLETDGKGVVISIVLILPFLIEHNQKYVPCIAENKIKDGAMNKGLTTTFAALSLLAVISSIATYLARAFGWEPLFPSLGAIGCALLAPIFPVVHCCVKKKSFLRGYLPMCLSFFALFAASLLVALCLPLEQIPTSVTQFSLISLLSCILLLSAFRMYFDFSPISSLQQCLENTISANFPKWFKRGDCRERLYFIKG